LCENQRFVLLRLSRLQDCFDLETGVGVGSAGELSKAETIECIASLVSKSLVERLEDNGSNFKLLDLIRHYASQKLISNDENGITKVRGENFEGLSWKRRRTRNADHKLQALAKQGSRIQETACRG
jgi:hypothetical protein